MRGSATRGVIGFSGSAAKLTTTPTKKLRGSGVVLGGEVQLHRHRQGAVAVDRLFDARVLAVQAVGQAEGRLQLRAEARQVADQEAGRHEDRLALGMRRAGHRRRCDQAVGERLLHRARHGHIAGGAEPGVAGQHLQGLADQAQLGLGVTHHLVGVQTALADGVGDAEAH
jgi:hypothetical protein